RRDHPQELRGRALRSVGLGASGIAFTLEVALELGEQRQGPEVEDPLAQLGEAWRLGDERSHQVRHARLGQKLDVGGTYGDQPGVEVAVRQLDRFKVARNAA